MVTALLFDLMDTVVYDPYREAFSAALRGDVRRGLERRDRTAWPRFELGELTEDEFAQAFFPANVREEPDAPCFDLAAFNAARHAGYRWVDGMDSLLFELRKGARARAVECHIASNYPVWIEQVREKFALDALFHGTHASYQLRARKPDEAFFTRLLARVGHAPERCLFVDDREDNCVAAEKLGLRAHTFRGVQDLRERLRQEGVLGP